MRIKIQRAAQATARTGARATRAVGLSMCAYLVGTSALALLAASYEPRFSLAVIGVAAIAFFLIDLAMLRRRSKA